VQDGIIVVVVDYSSVAWYAIEKACDVVV